MLHYWIQSSDCVVLIDLLPRKTDPSLFLNIYMETQKEKNLLVWVSEILCSTHAEFFDFHFKNQDSHL